jgi:hypothetical protein
VFCEASDDVWQRKRKKEEIKERQKMLIGKGGLNLVCDLHYKE